VETRRRIESGDGLVLFDQNASLTVRQHESLQRAEKSQEPENPLTSGRKFGQIPKRSPSNTVSLQNSRSRSDLRDQKGNGGSISESANINLDSSKGGFYSSERTHLLGEN
jgi:hypothetical protein